MEEQMRKDVLLAAAGIILLWPPVSASAGVCDGTLSFLCFNAGAETPDGSASAHTAGVEQSAATGTSDAKCLARDQVRGGYPRYRVINGRHCWYASSRPKHQERAQRRAKTDVNPYDDPIWQEADAGNSKAANCETQALKLHEDEKLGGDEKSKFLRDCKAGNLH
jgi:hypothetical protein